MKNTGVMCMVTIRDDNREDGQKQVDLGNYFEDERGEKCLITSLCLARKYGHLVSVPIYVMKSNDGGKRSDD